MREDTKTPEESITKGQCGFIYEVASTRDFPIEYRYGRVSLFLKPGEKFVGYFQQVFTNEKRWAYVHRTYLIDPENNRFEYGEVAVFDMDDVTFNFIALRGPASNNRYLPKEFEKYPTWISINTYR